jgi:probable rRNA maturation factor
MENRNYALQVMPSSTLHPPSSLVLNVASRQRTKKINARLLRQIADALLAQLEIETAELGIALVGAKEMARVNRQFLRHEGSTDVITFDHSSLESGIPNPELQLHGELFICVDDAVMQAKEFGTSWQSEIVRYVVHGVLHLLGHDDLKPERRRAMKREENRLVRRLAGRFSLAQLSGAAKLRA